MNALDLNADLGEGAANDDAILALVSSANIACGGHAGDEATMRRTLRGALAAGVAPGAHPGYPDRAHFGRREMALPPAAVAELVQNQVARLAVMAGELGARLHHVKPHGALYNQANRDPALAAAVLRGITAVAPDFLLYAPPAGALAAAAEAVGVTVCAEGFADRRYLADGSLVPRGEPGAVIDDPAAAAAQAVDFAHGGRFGTLCVHGDGPHAVELLALLRKALAARGIRIAAPGTGK